MLSQYNSIDENSSDDGKVVADNVKDLEYTDKDVDTDLEIMFEDLVSCSEAEIDNLLREYDDTSKDVNCETGEDGQVEKITIYEKVDISQDSRTSDACSEQFVYQDIRLRQEKKMVNKKTEKEAKTGRNCASFILIWGKEEFYKTLRGRRGEGRIHIQNLVKSVCKCLGSLASDLKFDCLSSIGNQVSDPLVNLRE